MIRTDNESPPLWRGQPGGVGTATDVTVAELAIEAFYPADTATAAALHERG